MTKATMIWLRYILLTYIIMIVLGAGYEVSAETQKPLTLTFGVYQSDKATTMYRKFVPVLEAIQDIMEDKLDRTVNIEIKIFKTYQLANDAIVEGSVDFVRFGPASYIIAKARNSNIRLLAMEHNNGQKKFKGVVVVPSDSTIKSLMDLKGKKMAFGDKNSTIGRYLVQAELVKAGVYAMDLQSFKYLGRHDLVAKSVELGDFDAGSIKIGTFVKYNKEKRLRIIHSFDNVTKPWIARGGLAPEVFSLIQQALLEIKDQQVLQELKISGFLPTSDTEYDFVRKGIEKAKSFDNRKQLNK